MSWRPPFREGVTPTERAKEVRRYCSERFRAAHALADMVADWAFCSVGCLYTYGGLDYDIVAEFVRTHPDLDCLVHQLTLPRPVFHGISRLGYRGREPFDHILLAVPREFWDGFHTHVFEAGMLDRRRGRYAQVTTQEVPVVDQVAVDRAIVAPAGVPTVPVTAFGIDGTHHHVVFLSRVDRPDDTALVTHLPVRDVTRKVAAAILAGHPNPHSVNEGDPLEQLRAAARGDG